MSNVGCRPIRRRIAKRDDRSLDRDFRYGNAGRFAHVLVVPSFVLIIRQQIGNFVQDDFGMLDFSKPLAGCFRVGCRSSSFFR